MTTKKDEVMENKVAIKVDKAMEKASSSIPGINGMEQEDIMLPYVYIVQKKSEHAQLADGSDAPAGTFFHNLKKLSYKEMEVIVLGADKRHEEKVRDTGPVMESIWRAVMVPTSSINTPFIETFRGYTNWKGWKLFLNMLRDEAVAHPFDKVVRMTTSPIKVGQEGNESTLFVPVFNFVRDTTEEERAVLTEMAMQTQSVKSQDDIPDFDLKDLDNA